MISRFKQGDRVIVEWPGSEDHGKEGTVSFVEADGEHYVYIKAECRYRSIRGERLRPKPAAPAEICGGPRDGGTDAMSHEWKLRDRAIVCHPEHEYSGKVVSIIHVGRDGCHRVQIPGSEDYEYCWGYKLRPLPPDPSPPRDGQANTSGLERAVAAEPSILTVLEGIGRWQQADPSKRRVVIELQGRLCIARLSTLDPNLRMVEVKIYGPDSAENIHELMMIAIEAASEHGDFCISSDRRRFNEDTGEIEP